jgi:transcriptional regulator with XRE-family HTH domain
MGGDKQKTRGGDMLARKASHAEIAAKVGRDKSLVTRWISGARTPSAADADKLAELFGVPVEAWREPAPKARARTEQSTPKKRRGSSESTTKTPTDPWRREGPGPEEGDGDDRTNVERLHAYIREGMRELEFDAELSGAKRAEALKKLVDAQVAPSSPENSKTTVLPASWPVSARPKLLSLPMKSVLESPLSL